MESFISVLYGYSMLLMGRETLAGRTAAGYRYLEYWRTVKDPGQLGTVSEYR